MCGSTFAQDKYQQFLSNKIVATKIPKLAPRLIQKRLHRLTYQELRNFSLLRVKSTIAGVHNFESLVFAGSSNVPKLKFSNGKGTNQLKPGDWIRILSVSQKDVAELESKGGKVEIGSFANGNMIYSMIALKMSPDFKRSEFFLLNAMASPTDEVAELDIFQKDLLATAWNTHINAVEAGDLLMSASEMNFGKQGKLLAANTPLVVESVTYVKQPWRFVWKYTLNMRIVNCPSEFKASNCRGIYEDEYMRKPMVFMGKIPVR